MDAGRTSTVPRFFASPLLAALLVLPFVIPISLMAQTGDNAVWGSSGITGSTAWVDASVWYTGSTGPDICAIMNGILTSNTGAGYPNYPSTGEVVDVRALSGTGTLPCATNPFASVTVPSTILLPAANISIEATWTLPSNTRIIGEGRTTILIDGLSSGSDMIEMGPSCSSSSPCYNVSLEHLKLMGAGTNSDNGIVNDYAQDGSYVNDVELFMIRGIGLNITSGAENSGPYSNINFGSKTTTTPCVCVQMQAQSRGLHGITCVGNTLTSASGHAGIYLNASNTTIEDVHIEGFWDGIRVGDGGAARGDTLSDVQGGSTGGGVQVTDVVHICGPNFNTVIGQCASTGETVTDLTIVGTRDANGGTCHTTVQDDVTGTTTSLGTTAVPATAVAVYALGEAVSGLSSSQFSRFATSPTTAVTQMTCGGGSSNLSSTAIPTWGVGGGTVSGTCTTPGAIYSNTAGTGTTNSIYVCTGPGTSSSWTEIF
jgi:hypothetical protein